MKQTDHLTGGNPKRLKLRTITVHEGLYTTGMTFQKIVETYRK